MPDEATLQGYKEFIEITPTPTPTPFPENRVDFALQILNEALSSAPDNWYYRPLLESGDYRIWQMEILNNPFGEAIAAIMLDTDKPLIVDSFYSTGEPFAYELGQDALFVIAKYNPDEYPKHPYGMTGTGGVDSFIYCLMRKRGDWLDPQAKLGYPNTIKGYDESGNEVIHFIKQTIQHPTENIRIWPIRVSGPEFKLVEIYNDAGEIIGYNEIIDIAANTYFECGFDDNPGWKPVMRWRVQIP